MVLVVGRHLACDALAQLLVNRGVIIIVSSLPMLVGHTSLRDIEDLRVLRSQPGWRRSRWSTQNNLQAVLMGQVHDPIEEVKMKGALLGFKDRPSKLRETNNAEAKLTHASKIIFPQTGEPLLRVVACPELKTRCL